MVSKFADENTLLAELKKGSANAFQFLYEENKYWMFIQAYGDLEDELAAQDLVQDLLIDFWLFKMYENIRSSLKGYLASIIRNRTYNYKRGVQRKEKRLQEMPVQEYLLPNLNLDSNQLSEKLSHALKKLPSKTLAVFTLFYEEGLSYKQIAQITGNSKFTINNHINKARKILRKELKKINFQ